MASKKESKRYQDMLVRVEEIVKKIQDETLDLDELVGEIEVGYELLAQMKERLETTKGKIEVLQQRQQEDSSSTKEGL